MSIDIFWRTGLKLRHLRLLILLDDHRHVGNVAQALHLTQPAISKALAEIEDGIGLKLFERSRRGINPNAYGESLIRHARELDAGLARAREELKSLSLGTSGCVSIGTLPAAASTLIPKALAVFKKQLPHASAIVREGSFETLLPDLRARNIHCIVGTLIPTRSYSDLDEQVLSNKPLTLVARKAHPLSRKKRLSWRDLEACEWVLPPVGAPMRRPLEEVFVRNNVPLPHNCVETTSTHLVASYVSHSDAIAFVPSEAARYYEQSGLLSALPIRLSGLLKPTGVVWCRDHPLDQVALCFMRCLETVSARR